MLQHALGNLLIGLESNKGTFGIVSFTLTNHFAGVINCGRTYHQKTGIWVPFTEGLVRGSIKLNLRHSTWPSCIPMFPPTGDLPFKWEVLCLNRVPGGQKRPPVMPLH